MKFLCLAYYDEVKMGAMPKADLQAMVGQCPAHDKELKNSGRLLFSASLGEPTQTVSIRPKTSGKPAITDGPFTETKEMIGGFFMIEADSIEEAKRIASLHPAAHLGEQAGWGIEVRPVGMFLDGQR